MRIGDIRPAKGAIKRAKRVGRGPGSGHGKTAGRGTKGQKARNRVQPWFEGGQMPITRRLPKRGFKSLDHREYQVVNVGDLARCGAPSIGPALLAEKGLVRSAAGLVKILADGEPPGALEVRAHAFSKAAKEKIEAAGGKAQWIDAKGADIAPPKPRRIYRPKPPAAAEEPAARDAAKEKGKEKGKAKAAAGASATAGAKADAEGAAKGAAKGQKAKG